ncbi:biotin synthase BioB [Aminipila terrae]|uniref:Biotin synthase n=1 Tax=Aminipila terrae TaxID=2697030 RepID=A0A6P1MMF4_9FIRM|nr:biotin synthase BioB [Aminipila terrae]QHI72836.1 biotin synthase BioB [Aminipila terrae]
MIQELKNKIINGYEISKEEALHLSDICHASPQNSEMLCEAANQIRHHFCGDHFDICTIINGKCGRCSEDCKYCAQSAHYPVETGNYSLLDADSLLAGARYNQEKGILRYSIVTSGRSLNDREVDQLCKSYKLIHSSLNISLCASHGLLNYQQLLKLRQAGVVRYHNNLETSRRNFSAICTTHTYQDKIATIKAAQKAGLAVCSGGIMGLGETMRDRIDMAFDLKELGIKSVPINILNPIPHTPFEHNPVLNLNEVKQIVALYRFILPEAALRLAGGRGLLKDKGRSVFASGANAAISGDMLTTSGISINYDINMIKDLGFKISKL